MNSQNFNDYVRQLRTKAKITQSELAERIGVSQGYWSHVESGRRVPNDDLLARFSSEVSASEEEFRHLRVLAADARSNAATTPPTLNIATVSDERERQAMAREVWVVAQRPLESTDTQYLRLVADAIASERCSYVYWTDMPDNFDKVKELVLSQLTKNMKQHDAQAHFRKFVRCVRAPSSAVWFSFVIYDPMQQKHTGFQSALALEEVPLPAGFVRYVIDSTDNEGVARAVNELKMVHFSLFGDSNNSHFSSKSFTTGGSTWEVHYPPHTSHSRTDTE